MTVYDLMDLFSDIWGELEIYDLESEKTVFKGDYSDIPENLDNADIMSIDWPNGSTLVINVSLEEED